MAWGLRTDEGGPVEQLQLAVLLIAAGLWLGVAFSARPTSPRWWVLAPLIAGGCLTGASREASWGAIWGASDAIVAATTIINAVMLAGLVGVSLIRVLQARTRPATHLASSPATFLATALVTFGISDLFERHVMALPKPQLAEEALELAAFSLLALGAAAALRRIG